MSEQEKDELRDKLRLHLVLKGISLEDYVGTGKGVNCKICLGEGTEYCYDGKRLNIINDGRVFESNMECNQAKGSPLGRCFEWIKYV